MRPKTEPRKAVPQSASPRAASESQTSPQPSGAPWRLPAACRVQAEARRLWEREAHSLTPTSVGGKKLTPISSFQIPVHMYIWIFSRGRFIWLSEFINFLWLVMSGSFIGSNSKREEEVINKPALQEMLIKATPRHRFGRVRMGSLWGPELLCPATLFVGMDSQQQQRRPWGFSYPTLSLSTDPIWTTNEHAGTGSCTHILATMFAGLEDGASHVPSANAQINKCVKSTIECYSTFPTRDVLTCPTACSNFEDAKWHLPRTGVISF